VALKIIPSLLITSKHLPQGIPLRVFGVGLSGSWKSYLPLLLACQILIIAPEIGFLISRLVNDTMHGCGLTVRSRVLNDAAPVLAEWALDD
jgi:hypothetical protein